MISESITWPGCIAMCMPVVCLAAMVIAMILKGDK